MNRSPDHVAVNAATEMADRLIVVIDRTCGICRAFGSWLGSIDQRGAFDVVRGTPGELVLGSRALGEQLKSSLLVISADGVFTRAAALREIAVRATRSRLLPLVWPRQSRLLDATYNFFAGRRRCAAACSLDRHE